MDSFELRFGVLLGVLLSIFVANTTWFVVEMSRKAQCERQSGTECVPLIGYEPKGNDDGR